MFHFIAVRRGQGCSSRLSGSQSASRYLDKIESKLNIFVLFEYCLRGT